MPETTPVTIDHIEPLFMSASRAPAHEKEHAALTRLFHGMRALSEQVAAQEAAALAVARSSPGELTFGHGQLPGFREAGIDTAFIACAFDWYSINACRFFNLLGFIADAHDGDIPAAKAYRARVCGKVLLYRNKVAAHHTLTDPRKNDNEADLYISTMNTVAFEDDRFFVGALQVGLGTGADVVESQHDYHWSMTEFHEEVVLPRVVGPR